ncbi:hypothetical protein CHS0354_029386 [Potamilus streckersoni]|uniref:Uncharacterized protein n=1 Tax=Potamilus streckersoni TaxID=2493646 RepID=A0AAE0STN3_9BIVA|nr:hypothetical protein CHS0354_029386 [Potamilus streckersoni]
MAERWIDTPPIIFRNRRNSDTALGTTLQRSTPTFDVQRTSSPTFNVQRTSVPTFNVQKIRLRIQQSHPKILEDVTKLVIELESILCADKQQDHRTTA